MTKYVIIVAGGSGLRMGNVVPKQFLHLCGRPVLMHTIEAFYNYDCQIRVIVVLPQEQQDFWKELCDRHEFQITHQVAVGGKTRFHSVKNGLELVWIPPEETAVVAIHDGVRPLISANVIASCFDLAEKEGGAFPVIPVTDTLRKKTGKESVLVDRNDYFLVQTPQVFRSDIIKKAYEQEYSDQFTDDVSVVEALGQFRVREVEGDRENIKITTPVDLVIAEMFKTSRLI